MSILTQPHSLRQLAGQFLDELLPASCLLCSADSGGSLLCPACADDLPLLPAALCPQCSLPTTFGERCGACLHEPPHFDGTYALFRYDFPVDRIVHALKYGHQLAVAEWLGDTLAARLTGQTFELIVPLPLHAQRLAERGFNQAAEIATHLEKRLKIPVDRYNLQRTRATPAQAELPLKERHRNVRGAFECRCDFSGRHLLLLDDVMTSGATASECARVLKLHGAASVTVAVAARALKHSARHS